MSEQNTTIRLDNNERTERDSDIGINITWNSTIEILLSNWCDQAKCFVWMNSEAYSRYAFKSKVFLVLIIVLSMFNGLANVIVGNNINISWLFGSFSIIISMVTMLQEKLAYASLSNEHQSYYVQWNIIVRKIQEELCIPRESRKDCQTFLKVIRQDINQVSINNIKIPYNIKRECYEKFKDEPDFDIPDICGQIEHTIIYTSPSHNHNNDTSYS